MIEEMRIRNNLVQNICIQPLWNKGFLLFLECVVQYESAFNSLGNLKWIAVVTTRDGFASWRRTACILKLPKFLLFFISSFGKMEESAEVKRRTKSLKTWGYTFRLNLPIVSRILEMFLEPGQRQIRFFWHLYCHIHEYYMLYVIFVIHDIYGILDRNGTMTNTIWHYVNMALWVSKELLGT